MTWKISDIVVALFTAVIVQNVLFLIEMFCQKKFLDLISLKQHYFLLRILILLAFFPIFFLLLIVLHENTFLDTYFIYGEDIKQLLVIRYRSFSTNLKGVEIGTIFFMIFFIWFLGFVVIFLIRVLKDRALINNLKKVSKIVEDEKTINIAYSMMNAMKINCKAKIYKNDIIVSPFIVGFKKVYIFIPDMDLTDLEQELIFRHEFVHNKRRDYLFKRFLLFIKAFFWFNPFICIFEKYFYNIGEMACDEEVLLNETDSTRYLYGCLIIRMLDKNLKIKTAVGLANSDALYIERRIIKIMKKDNRSNKVLFMLSCIFFIGMCPVTSLAAATGSSISQDKIIREIVENNSVEEEHGSSTNYQGEQQAKFITGQNQSNTQVTRGYNNIDCYLNGKEQLITNSIYLAKGAKVKMYLTGDSSDNKFRAGIIINGSARYVTANSGKVDHTFTINEAGYYDVYIEGTTSASIHIRGLIDIAQ